MSLIGYLAIGIPLTAAVAALVMAAVVFFFARDRSVARSFSGMAAILGLWQLGLALESKPALGIIADKVIQWCAYPWMLVPAAVLHAAVRFCRMESKDARPILICMWTASAFLVGFRYLGFMDIGYLEYSWGRVRRPGALLPLYGLFIVASAGFSLWLSDRTRRHSPSEDVRLAAKYWLLSTAIGFSLGALTFLPNYGVSMLPIGGLGIILMVLIIGYAAVRHRVLDIDVLILRSAAFSVAAVIAVLPLTVTFVVAQEATLGSSSHILTTLFLGGIALILTFFSRLRSYFEKGMEASFFPARHAARAAIRAFSEEVVRLPRRQHLGSELTRTLVGCLEVDGAALYVAGAARNGFQLAASAGEIDAPESIRGERLLGPAAKLNEKHIFFEPGTALLRADSPRPAARLQWEACVPVRTDDACLGLIALGPKASRAAIDDSDVTLLSTLAAQVAVALLNAEYVGEIEGQKTEIEELQQRLAAENVVLRQEAKHASRFTEIIGSSAALRDALAVVERTADSDATILITGETGTGKELIARAIHELSSRRAGPLISVNCPAIPPHLAESELFGHERGAFTDALQARPGKFELADGGTILLDEIADLPLEVQVKLLRVLQERETQRVGSHKLRKLDIRVLAATNRDLHEEMRANRFREDLFYRLATVVVHVPALRERGDDIPMLASYFLERAGLAYQKVVRGFTPEAMEALRCYSWPGNIRELQSVVERAVLLCAGDVIRPEYLSDLAAGRAGRRALGDVLRAEKARRIRQALSQTAGNQAAAARLLGISRANLNRLMKSLGIRAERELQ